MSTAEQRIESAEVADLLNFFYNDELLGEAVFAELLRLSRHLTDEQRRKINTCRVLEIQIKTRIAEHIRQRGERTSDTGRGAIGKAMAVELAKVSWPDVMQAFEPATADTLAQYRRLKALYAHREPDLCAHLMAHELALRDFARDELKGETENSLERVLVLLDESALRSLRVASDV